MKLRFFEYGRFYVTSSEEYLIDIYALEGNGFCSCHDFTYRHLPIVQESIECGMFKLSRCKHIKFVLEAIKSNQDSPTLQKGGNKEPSGNSTGEDNEEEISSVWHNIAVRHVDSNTAKATTNNEAYTESECEARGFTCN